MNVIPTTICLIGSYGVGKSSLVSSYIYNKFNNIESTIGMSFFTKLIKHDNYCIDLSIWDTAGQERYSSLLSMYTRNANIILSMLDPTNPTDSYNYVEKNIVNVLENRINDPPYCIHIVISKMDTQKNKENAEKLAKKTYKFIKNLLKSQDNSFTTIEIFYISSYRFINIKEPFIHCLEKIYREKTENIQENTKETDRLLLYNSENELRKKCSHCSYI